MQSKQIIAILVLIFIAVSVYCYLNSSPKQIEPYQPQLKYATFAAPPPSSNDTLSSSGVSSINFSALQDISSFDLNKNDPNSFDFASLAGITKTANDVQTTQKETDSSTYNDPSLPQQDMSSIYFKDPSDPTNFLYDRNIFTSTRSIASRNPSDFLRGDLEIPVIKRGMFDVTANPSTDLTKGYFASFNDISDEHNLQDVTYNSNSDPFTVIQ